MSEARAYMPKVTVVPATLNRFTAAPIHSTRKRRVAAYARVSTNDEEQANSYEAQVSHYTRHIQENPEWEFVSVYADKGITGTSTKKREQFNDMVQDALAGKIDLIITKSVSRFARNTVDTLTTIRLLKEHGVEVYFEEQNIYSLDSKGELLLTIMSSLAQEESRNISENVTWGMRKRFADGKVALPYKQFLGYKKGADGIPEIVPEEAATIKLIYRLFMEGEITCVHRPLSFLLQYSFACREAAMAARNGKKHSVQREIQGRRHPAKDLLHGFPDQENEGERGRGSSVLR